MVMPLFDVMARIVPLEQPLGNLKQVLDQYAAQVAAAADSPVK